MNKKAFFTALLALVTITGQAQKTTQDWFKTDTITIRGRIQGYDAEKFGFTTMYCAFEDVFENSEAPQVMDIAPDGTFEKRFVASYPSMNHFYTYDSAMDFNEIPFFARPGETIYISVRPNAQGKYECIYNNGSSKEVERWLKSRKMMQDQCSALPSFPGKFSDLQIVADSVWNNLMQCVSSVSQQFHYTPFEVQLAQAEAQVQFLSAMMTCAKTAEISDSTEWQAVRDSRNYAALRHIDFNNPLLLSCMDFQYTLNLTEFSPLIHTQMFALIKNEKGEYESFESLTYNKMVLENVCKGLHKMFNTDDSNTLMSQLCNYKNMHQLLKKWILNEEELADTTYSESFRQELASNCASPENMFPLYLATFTHPYVQQKAKQFYISYIQQKGLFTPLPPDNPAAEFIRKISARYPGYYLYVDFWGMSCPGCKSEIEKSKQIRAEIADQYNIKFIFIADENNPNNEAYKKYVSEWLMDEEVVCVNHTDFRRLQELFHFNVIPHYEVFTPDCRRVHDEFIRQGYDSIKYILKRLGVKNK